MTNSGGKIYFVYDGKCPICNVAAQGLRIRKSVGELHLINARSESEHPLIQEITARHINLDDGMVIVFNDVYYHGHDALHIMALLGSNKGWFNRMNSLLFKSKLLAKLLYPSMRGTRNVLLKMKHVEQIRNLKD
jgi:predicted DCC family thiol-disulfide oxidoreductase YuxK